MKSKKALTIYKTMNDKKGLNMPRFLSLSDLKNLATN